jgi:hypothetical protein
LQKSTPFVHNSADRRHMAPEGHGGDLLFQISTLAGIEPLLALHPDADCRVSLKGVWEEVTDVTGLYCIFVTEAIATILLKLVPGVSVDDITIPDAPEANADPLRFFVHPPSDLKEMRALAKSPAGVAGRSAFARPGAGRHRCPGQRRGRPTSFSCCGR